MWKCVCLCFILASFNTQHTFVFCCCHCHTQHIFKLNGFISLLGDAWCSWYGHDRHVARSRSQGEHILSLNVLYMCTRLCFRVTQCSAVHPGARGAVFPGAVFVPHGAGEGGGDGGRDQARDPPGQVHLLLHLLIAGWGGAGGGNEEVECTHTHTFFFSMTYTHSVQWRCVVVCRRLGFTYLRLKDSHMEILNREDEIERWACSFLTMCISLTLISSVDWLCEFFHQVRAAGGFDIRLSQTEDERHCQSYQW